MRVSAGTALPVFEVEEVRPAAMKTMAVLLRDPNPIHFNPDVVAALGMGDRVINQGPTNMAYVVNMLVAWAGDPARIRALKVRFLDNVRGWRSCGRRRRRHVGGRGRATPDRRVRRLARRRRRTPGAGRVGHRRSPGQRNRRGYTCQVSRGCADRLARGVAGPPILDHVPGDGAGLAFGTAQRS